MTWLRQRAAARALPVTAVLLAGLTLALAAPARAAGQTPGVLPFEINPGDHICIIGNTLADRMQHDGWLETYLQARFPTLAVHADSVPWTSALLRKAKQYGKEPWL